MTNLPVKFNNFPFEITWLTSYEITFILSIPHNKVIRPILCSLQGSVLFLLVFNQVMVSLKTLLMIFQRFKKLVGVYHLVVSAYLYFITICLWQGRRHLICIRPWMSRYSLSERPSNSSGVFRLYLFLPCNYLSLDHCLGSSGSTQKQVNQLLLRMY